MPIVDEPDLHTYPKLQWTTIDPPYKLEPASVRLSLTRQERIERAIRRSKIVAKHS